MSAFLTGVVVALKLEIEASGRISGDMNRFAYLLLTGGGNINGPMRWFGAIREDCQIYLTRHRCLIVDETEGYESSELKISEVGV